MNRVTTIKEIQWPFEDEYCSKPYAHVKINKARTRRIDVDPFPCYAHDKDDVVKIVNDIESKFPIKFKPKYFILHHEILCRVNGMSYQEYDYSKKEAPYNYTPFIIISGKRVPIHPAITRYLIPHEYGHAVEDWILHTEDITEGTQGAIDFKKEYAKMRKVKYSSAYGGNNWDTNIGEVFANDFRILVGGYEPEFWQHKSVQHPNESKDAKIWWKKAIKKWAVKGD